MTYLITGHNGFIGTNLTNFLHSKCEEVIGLDYSDCDLCEGFPGLIWDLRIDVIIHLAAETNVRDSIAYPVKTFLRNCESTINILELAREKRAKLVFISSCGARYLSSPYAASKSAGEGICNAYRESYNMDIVILHLPNVYGPFSLHKTSVIPNFIKSKLKGYKALIYGDGSQTRDFIYVKDVCKAIYNAEEDLKLTTGQLTSINRLAKMIGCEVEYTGAIKGELTKVTSIRNIITDYSLEQGLSETIEWFKEKL